MSRFDDIFLLPCETGPRASLTPKGPFEKNINESRKTATNFGTTSKIGNYMNIIADQNIPFVEKAFSEFGSVTLMNGRDITKKCLENAEMLLVRSITKVNKELLEGTPVRFIATATIGTDHVDLEYLQEQNIGFASAPGSNANSVAEYVIAAILTYCKNKHCSPRDLTLGIVGVGNVGSRLLQLAQGLGISCLLNDPPKKRLTGSDLYQPLNDVLSKADILSLHVPLITQGKDKTYHMVNNDFLAQIKGGALLINSSRGKVVNEKDLKQQRSRLGGLVLDVWENEPTPDTDLIVATDISTAHIAGYSYNGKISGAQMIYEKACYFNYKEVTIDLFEEIKHEKGEIDLAGSLDPLHDAVLGAYNIIEDSDALRALTSLSDTEQGQGFDDLRKNYKSRLEFNHFVIKNAPEETVGDLKRLGFQVQE